MGRSFLVQCRGLPWECTDDQLKEFFGKKGIEYVDIPRRGGKAVGEAVVAFETESDYKNALRKNKEHMGNRWIEVYSMDSRPPPPRRRADSGGDRDGYRASRDSRASRDRGAPYNRDREDRRSRYDRERDRGNQDVVENNGIIRLRGLPFSVTNRDIIDFFAPLSIVRDGILLPDQRRAKVTGEALVVFEHPESAKLAKNRHMKNIGHRYIEVFEASLSELTRFADENGLMIPRGGPAPVASYNPPIDYRPPADGYRRDDFGGMPPRGGPEPEDPFGRSRAAPVSDFGSRGVGYGSVGGGLVDPYRQASPPRGGPPQGFYEYGSKPSYESFPRNDLGPDPRDLRGVPPQDPYSGQRYGEYSVSGQGGYDTRDPYPPSNWRGAGGDIGNGVGGPPPRDAYDRGIGIGSGSGWPSGPTGFARGDAYGFPIDQPYGQREGGGAIRREEFDSRYGKRPDPYVGGYANREIDIRAPQQAHFVLRMRGVPFRATEADVYDFFLPVRPNHIELLRDNSGRPSGDARVIFFSRKDYDDALSKDRQYIGDRYIEMIPDNGRY